MFSSKLRNKGETQPRSDSEIEVDFVCHETTKERKKDNEKKRVKKSFSVTSHSENNGEEDTEGSSIIDLRTKRKCQKRSRSLDQLEDSTNRSTKPKDHSRKATNRSLRNPSRKDHKYIFDQRMSFHTSLQDLSSDDQQQSWKRKPTSHQKVCSSRSDTKRTDEGNDSASSSDEWDKIIRQTDYQMFMKKPNRYSGNFRKNSFVGLATESPPNSPNFSYRSSLNLLPSSDSRKGLRQQIIVTVTSSLAPLACGFAVGYSMTKNPQNLITHSLNEWAQYIFILGAIVGAFLSGILSNFGRKVPLFLTMSLLLVGWVAVIFATEPWMVMLFYGLSGGCTSLSLVLSQIYIAEISISKVRGALSTTPLLAFHIGLLFCFVFEDMFSWKNFAIIGVSFIAPFYIMVVLCMPESPRFLIHTNPNEALAMLQWLRGFSNDVMKEYKEIANNCYVDRWCLRKSEIRKPSFWMPLIITCVLMFLFSMSGVASISLYGRSLFQEMSLTYPNISYIIVTTIILVGIIISSVLVDQVGRKLLLLLSLTIMAASAFALGLFLFLKDIHKVETYFVYQWTAEIFCIVLFTLAHGAAVAPITWLTLGETFGTKLKWVGVSLSSVTLWLSMLLIDVSYNRITLVIATGGLFWFHCIICVGGYIFILLFFRELRDHKIDDVAKVFLKKNENLIDTFITKI